MALTQKKLSKAKQIRLAATLIAVIGITLGVAYYGFLKKPAPADPSDLIDSDGLLDTDTVIITPRDSGFKQVGELADDPLFKKLKSFGQWPLSLEPKGRSQPFIQSNTDEE